MVRDFLAGLGSEDIELSLRTPAREGGTARRRGSRPGPNGSPGGQGGHQVAWWLGRSRGAVRPGASPVLVTPTGPPAPAEGHVTERQVCRLRPVGLSHRQVRRLRPGDRSRRALAAHTWKGPSPISRYPVA